MLDEALVNVCALWRIRDASVGTHLEESLSHSFVHDNQGVLRQDWLFRWVKAILLLHDLFELFKLMTDNLSSHGVSDSVSVDEDVIWQLSLVVISECLEGTLEVLLKHS